MQIAVAQAAAIEDRHVVQERAVTVRGRSQPVKVISKHLGLIQVDLDDLVDERLLVRMVRDGVVSVGNAEFAIRPAVRRRARIPYCSPCDSGPLPHRVALKICGALRGSFRLAFGSLSPSNPLEPGSA